MKKGNDAMHRGDLFVFQDRVEVVNPGGLVAGLREKDLGRVSRPRNSLLFSILERMDLVENIGSGIQRMRDNMKEEGLPAPIIDIGDTWFSISFFRTVRQSVEEDALESDGALNGALSGALSGALNQQVLDTISRFPGIQRKDLVEKLDASERTADRYIAELVSDGKIERRGSKKTGGYWRIKSGAV